jgi:hypothetical protein
MATATTELHSEDNTLSVSGQCANCGVDKPYRLFSPLLGMHILLALHTLPKFLHGAYLDSADGQRRDHVLLSHKTKGIRHKTEHAPF